jgi:flagella basal body P-ring formation protein FlgA
MSTLAALFTLLAVATGSPSDAVDLAAEDPELAVRAAAAAAAPGGKVVIPPQAFAALPAPASDLAFSARALPAQGGGERLMFEVAAHRGRDLVARRAYAFEVRDVRAVVVPRRALRAGDPVTAEDVELTELELSMSRDRLAEGLHQVVGRIARGPLAAGRPIPLRGLKAPEVVKRGERLTVQVRHGALTVRMAAEALESGGVDDQVKVLNPASRRVLTARVLEDGLAEVTGP